MTKSFITGLIVLVMVTTLVSAGGRAEGASSADEQETIVVAINNAPWLPGYEGIAAAYERETGIRVDLRVFPFAQLTERARAAAESDRSEFDIITMNNAGSAQFYAAGLLTPLREIDARFTPDSAMINYFYGDRWNANAGYATADGDLLSIPINGNIQIFFYRADLYAQAGLQPPETWADVMNASRVIAGNNPNLFGYANRGQSGTLSVSWDFYPFLRSNGGDVFANAPEDWTVVVNSDAAIEALELYLELAHEHSPPNVSSIGQAEQVALLQSGRLLQTIVVSGAFAQMDDLASSSVVNNIGYTILPRMPGGQHAANVGELVQGIPRNLPQARKEAALKFLEFVTSYDGQVEFGRAGGVPVRTDVYTAPELAGDPAFRYFDAMLRSEPYLISFPRIPEGLQYTDVLERRLNEAISKQLSAREALNLAAEEIYRILDGAGYPTGFTPNN